MTARIGLKRSRLPLRPFCLSATPAKYLPNFLEVTTDPYKMTYDWESEDSLGSACGSVGIGQGVANFRLAIIRFVRFGA